MNELHTRYLDKHEEILSFRELSDRTFKSYTSYLTRFLEWAEVELNCPDVRNISWEQIRLYIRTLKTVCGLNPRTVNVHISQLKDFFEYVLRRPWDRYAVLSRKALSILTTYIRSTYPQATKDDWLFPGQNGKGHVTTETVRQVFKRALYELGWEDKGFTLHSLRHAFGLHLHQSGVDLMTIYENQNLLYNLMFNCSSDTLLTLCEDKRYMGAKPGIVSVLHTQGSRLNYHPHIHTMLSGGGITPDHQFIETQHKGYLLPVKAMGKLFRGKFLSALKRYHDNDQLELRGRCSHLRNRFEWKEFIDKLYSKAWNPFIKETFNGFGNAIRYLARYVFRSAISNNRIDAVNDSGVTFHYKDYADHQRTKQLHMDGEAFIDAFLMHVLPKGFCRVRFSGYLSNCSKTRNLKLIHSLRGSIYQGNPVNGKNTSELMMLLYGRDICHCPNCKTLLQKYARGMPLTALIAP